MRELFTSTDFYVGLGALLIVFILNEIYPMISKRGMYIVSAGLAG